MADASTVDLTGRTAIVTGATSGIGREIARGLAGHGADLVIGVRDAVRGAEARAELDAAGPGTVTVLALDVAEQASIRTFVQAFRADHNRLDILVNNAGTWFTDRRASSEGVEMTFATNVVGPYLLTELLADPLRAAGGRIVNVVSDIARDYNATDLQFTIRPYSGFGAYAQSKQALRMLTWGQANRFDGTGVTANAVNPGFVRTGFNRNASGLQASMIKASARLFAQTPAKGADTAIWAAVDPGLDGATGHLYAKRTEIDGKYRDPAPIADLERQLAELTEATAS